VANGVALEVLGGENYTVKNNIFANNGGGLAAKVDIDVSANDWDYNDYFSIGDEFGSYLGIRYSNLGTWGSALNSDANSNLLDPFFLDEVDLRPSQRAINGAGIAAAGVLLDIDGELRNQTAPDVGADEYLVDFGITQLISPTMHCGLGSSDSVTILIRQFGDVPFIDLKVAYQVNGGEIDVDTVPGQLTNDIQYTFNSTKDLAGHGSYVFKIWLIGTNDDNINNDTLIINRYSSDVPVVDFAYTSDCAGEEIPFIGSASVSNGTIESYEWIFSDGDTAWIQNPIHSYGVAGNYSATLRAYTDKGCFGDITKAVDIITTPEAYFSSGDVCYGEEVVLMNQSTVTSGEITYLWDFGDGNSSDQESPVHDYVEPGTYQVSLTAIASSGCSNVFSDSVKVNQEIFHEIEISNDTAMAIISGGTPFRNGIPYAYEWSTGAGTAMITGLTEATYRVTVTDSAGCMVMDSAEVVLPELEFLLTGTHAACPECADGQAIVDVVQGVAPYYYEWSNGSLNDTASGLVPGIYYVTVRDAYLNAVTDSIIIESQPPPVLSFVTSDPLCLGHENGSIDLIIESGREPYTILWSNGEVSEDIEGLSAGRYIVEVTDANGEMVSDSVTLNEPDSLQVFATITNVSCPGGNNGSIELSILGGTIPYETSWSNGSVEKNQASLPSGIYDLLVTDSNGCISAWSGVIEEKSSSMLYGIARYSLGYIDEEDADVVLLDGSQHPYRIVAETRMQAGGYFHFSGIPEGYYLVYVKIDNHAKQKYKGVMHSYYNEEFKWKEASRFFFRCDDTLSIVMDMYENPAAENGNGEINGKVKDKENKLKEGGVPYAFVTVMLIDEFSGLPVDYVITDGEGNYQFTGVSEGEYTVYVDIPGLNQITTHHVTIDQNTTQLENIDFEVDYVEEMIISAVFPTSIDSPTNPSEETIQVYPNPASQRLVITSSLFEDQEVKMSLFTGTGELIRTFESRPPFGSNDVVLDLGMIERSGYYLLRVEAGDVVEFKNIIVVK
jgi:PKD repeat protein